MKEDWAFRAVMFTLTTLFGYAFASGLLPIINDPALPDMGPPLARGLLYLGTLAAGIFMALSGIAVFRTLRGLWKMYEREYLLYRFKTESILDIAVETYRRNGHAVDMMPAHNRMFVAERGGRKTLVCVDSESPHPALSGFSMSSIGVMRTIMESGGMARGQCVSDYADDESMRECAKAANIDCIESSVLGMMAFRTRRPGEGPEIPVTGPCPRCGHLH